MPRPTYERFDVVSIITTRNVKWMVDLPGHIPDPNGTWTIVCCFPKTGELLITKGSATCRIPISDVRKIANYSIDSILNNIRDKHV